MEQFSWWAVSLGVICPSGNYVGENHPEGNFPWGQLPGAYCQSAVIFGVIVQEQYYGGNHPGAIIWRATVLGGNCQGWNFLRGQLSLRAIVWGGNNPETDYPGSRFPREQLSGHHLQPNKLQKKANFNPIY